MAQQGPLALLSASLLLLALLSASLLLLALLLLLQAAHGEASGPSGAGRESETNNTHTSRGPPMR